MDNFLQFFVELYVSVAIEFKTKICLIYLELLMKSEIRKLKDYTSKIKNAILRRCFNCLSLQQDSFEPVRAGPFDLPRKSKGLWLINGRSIQPKLGTFRQQDQVERKTPEVIFVRVSTVVRWNSF